MASAPGAAMRRPPEPSLWERWREAPDEVALRQHEIKKVYYAAAKEKRIARPA